MCITFCVPDATTVTTILASNHQHRGVSKQQAKGSTGQEHYSWVNSQSQCLQQTLFTSASGGGAKSPELAWSIVDKPIKTDGTCLRLIQHPPPLIAIRHSRWGREQQSCSARLRGATSLECKICPPISVTVGSVAWKASMPPNDLQNAEMSGANLPGMRAPHLAIRSKELMSRTN
ncbi:hypothetical protein BC567DRAFT_76488 [Phyllosticta citribraziliensis]